MSDDVEALAVRCIEAWRKCPQPSEDFQFIRWMTPSRMPWRVGFYERDYGKHVADGRTLSSALRKWLADYENHWDQKETS